MDAFPSEYNACFDASYLSVPTTNSIKAVCNVAVRVSVPAPGGIVKWTPAVNDSYGYLYPGPGNPNNIPMMNCKEHNASGLLDGEPDTVTRLTPTCCAAACCPTPRPVSFQPSSVSAHWALARTAHWTCITLQRSRNACRYTRS